MRIALAWLLHWSPNILLIPAHRRFSICGENLMAATLDCPRKLLLRSTVWRRSHIASRVQDPANRASGKKLLT